MDATRNGAASKAVRILLAAALALGALLPAAALAPAEAQAAQRATLTVGPDIEYDAFFTSWFEVDGQPAWCGNPSKPTPQGGDYDKQPLSAPSGRVGGRATAAGRSRASRAT